MKYKFCSIRINVTKYEIAFATKEGVLTSNRPPPLRVVTSLNSIQLKISEQQRKKNVT